MKELKANWVIYLIRHQEDVSWAHDVGQQPIQGEALEVIPWKLVKEPSLS